MVAPTEVFGESDCSSESSARKMSHDLSNPMHTPQKKEPKKTEKEKKKKKKHGEPTRPSPRRGPPKTKHVEPRVDFFSGRGRLRGVGHGGSCHETPGFGFHGKTQTPLVRRPGNRWLGISKPGLKALNQSNWSLCANNRNGNWARLFCVPTNVLPS